MRSLTSYGTYGFLAAVIALQMAISANLARADVADKADRTTLDAKKSSRSFKRDVKKGARKATGHDNTWDDVKDSASDTGKNLKDEAGYQKRKLERKQSE